MNIPVEWLLIRHGMSSASSRRQRQETGLGPPGRWQALQAAEHKLGQHNIDHLFTSPLARADETAQIIGKLIGLSPIIIHELREIERPTNIYGARHDSPHNLAYKKAWKAALASADLDWKHEGRGESLRELITRVRKLRRYLSQKYPGQKLVLVGHAVQLACLNADIRLGEDASPEAVVELAKLSFLKHGGLAHLRFENGGWRLIHFDRS